VIPQLQSGVLAYRTRKKGGVEILLVRKPLSQSWGIPKGKIATGLALPENAAKEALEEAGIKGRVRQEASGSYRAMKRRGDRQILIEVWVFLFEVTSTAKRWKEKDMRFSRWHTIPDAIRLLREPFLVELCHKLAAGILPGSR
jgi:8-oxo-dGTP pyrophosphatase MutT (NUDIX family)